MSEATNPKAETTQIVWHDPEEKMPERHREGAYHLLVMDNGGAICIAIYRGGDWLLPAGGAWPGGGESGDFHGSTRAWAYMPKAPSWINGERFRVHSDPEDEGWER